MPTLYQVNTVVTNGELYNEATVRAKLAASAGAVAVNSQKVTSLANGTAATDAVNLGQLNAILTGAAPANVTKSAAVVGVATTAARADHKHDVTTAVAVSVGTVNAEGVSTSLSRADHVHAIGPTLQKVRRVIDQPADGSDFTVTIPTPMLTDTYEVAPCMVDGAAAVVIQCPDTLAGDRTTTTFRVLTSGVLLSGNSISFILLA